MRVLDFENGRVTMTKAINWKGKMEYVVCYGLQVKKHGIHLKDALEEFNSNVLHALSCDGLTDIDYIE